MICNYDLPGNENIRLKIKVMPATRYLRTSWSRQFLHQSNVTHLLQRTSLFSGKLRNDYTNTNHHFLRQLLEVEVKSTVVETSTALVESHNSSAVTMEEDVSFWNVQFWWSFSRMYAWFFTTGCLFGVVIILLFLNGLIFYRQRLYNTLNGICVCKEEIRRVQGGFAESGSRSHSEESGGGAHKPHMHIFTHKFREERRNTTV